MGGRTGAALKIAHLDSGAGMRGGQRQVLALVRGLAARGVDGVLLAREGGRLAVVARDAGVRVATWRPRLDVDVPALARAAGVLRAERPDLVHAHDARSHALGWAASRLAGIRALVVARRTDAPIGRNPASRLKYHLPVDRYLAVSRRVAENLRRAGVPPERVAVVPSGIVLDAPSAAPDLRAALGVAPGTPLAFMAASWTTEKGHDLAIGALARLAGTWPVLHLVAMGDGPAQRRTALAALAATRGVGGRVRFEPWREDARAVMRQCDMVLAPSRVEGLGTAVLEAQAEGVPVVAAAVGGLPELVVDGDTGWLVPPDDEQALARAMAQVLEDRAGARERAGRARAAVRAFGIDRTVDATLEVYREVLGPGA